MTANATILHTQLTNNLGPISYVCLWLSVLKKSDRRQVLESAYRRSGHTSFPPLFAEAVLHYWPGWVGFCGICQAIMGCGGGLAVCAANLFRFWTVAVRRNSSRAPDRPLNLSLTIERIFLASPNSASIFFRSPLEST